MSHGGTNPGRRVTEYELREEMARIGRLMWERGYVAATDGNISVRAGPDRLLATPSGLSKGFLYGSDMVAFDIRTLVLTPRFSTWTPFSATTGSK